MKNPYEVLGISPTATNEEVRAAYRNLAKKYHPDNYIDSPVADLAEQKMKDINWAYDEILKMRAGKQKGDAFNNNGFASSGNGNNQSYTGGAGSFYSQIRSMLNSGNFNAAEAMLNDVKKNDRNAEWYFLKGCVLTRRGYYFDAIKFIDKACTMDPNNQEYRMARDNLRAQSYHYGNQPQGNAGGCNMCDICSALICIDCLCGRGC